MKIQVLTKKQREELREREEAAMEQAELAAINVAAQINGMCRYAAEMQKKREQYAREEKRAMAERMEAEARRRKVRRDRVLWMVCAAFVAASAVILTIGGLVHHVVAMVTVMIALAVCGYQLRGVVNG